MIQLYASTVAWRRRGAGSLFLAGLLLATPCMVYAGHSADASLLIQSVKSPALPTGTAASRSATELSRLTRPLAQIAVTSAFGWRLDPVRKRWQLHKGVDYAAMNGTPIYAAQNGTIEMMGRRRGDGLYIRIRHGNGIETGYAHLSRFVAGLRRGSVVRCGEPIGEVGATGDATGPHLHFEVMDHGKPTDPQAFNAGQSIQVARLQ